MSWEEAGVIAPPRDRPSAGQEGCILLALIWIMGQYADEDISSKETDF
jgi:hypothetical protein